MDKNTVYGMANEYGHKPAYLNIIVRIGGEPCVLMPRNAWYGNMTSFGGESAKREKLSDTITRTTGDQSLNCIATAGTLVDRLYSTGTIFEHADDSGRMYTTFLTMKDDEFPLEEVRDCFNRKRGPHYALRKEQRENDSIHAVPLRSFKNGKVNQFGHFVATTTDEERIAVYNKAMPALLFMAKLFFA